MSVKIYQDTKIFIACPANFATGGPELLHQLTYHLRKDLSIDAYMYYYNFDENKFKNPVHREYEKYNNPFVTKLNELEKTYTIRKAIKEAKRCLKCHLEK
jgi:hypothetical protein